MNTEYPAILSDVSIHAMGMRYSAQVGRVLSDSRYLLTNLVPEIPLGAIGSFCTVSWTTNTGTPAEIEFRFPADIVGMPPCAETPSVLVRPSAPPTKANTRRTPRKPVHGITASFKGIRFKVIDISGSGAHMALESGKPPNEGFLNKEIALVFSDEGLVWTKKCFVNREWFLEGQDKKLHIAVMFI